MRLFNNVLQEALRVQGEMREEALRDYAQRKESGYADSFGGHISESDLIVKRADSLVLSFLATSQTYTGGAHGMMAYRGVNFDAATGERLSLHQVFPDGVQLVETVIEKLRTENNPAGFFDSMEATVADQIIHDKVSWVIGPRGVTFYFNPYDIAPYAGGIIATTIMFDDRPELFSEKYKHGPASYCEELTTYPADTVSLHDDGMGKADTIEAFVDGDTFSIVMNGQRVCQRGFFGENKITPVFVHTGDGKNYLYVDYGYGSKFGAGRQIDIYGIDSGRAAFIGTFPYTLRRRIDLTDTGENWIGQWIMTDPHEFNIDEQGLEKNGESKTHTAGISENGMPAFG